MHSHHLSFPLLQCNFTFNFTNFKRKEQITCHSTSSNTFSSKPSPACRFPAVSHRLHRCQSSSFSVLPSSMPLPATFIPTPAFSFHLPRHLNVTFHFLPPSVEISPRSFTLTDPLSRLLPAALPPRTSTVTKKRTTPYFFGKFKLHPSLTRHLRHIPYFICFAYATCKVRCLSTRGPK